MVYEFEGRSEKEAIDLAAEKLGLEKDDFDVEILESKRSGLFSKGFVRIRVHTNGLLRNAGSDEGGDAPRPGSADENRRSGKTVFGEPTPKNEFEKKITEFVEGLIERMGYSGNVTVLFREDKKIGLKIDSEHSSIIIGKKGKNLDAIQLLANIYAGRLDQEDMRVILDIENYRIRREEALVRLAYTVADRVRENRASMLLEPMNPFDRRLIHTTLNDISDVETKSEGEGLFKQIRVFYRGLR